MASKIAGLYDMEKTLGAGHFAVVKSARHVFTGLRVAIKVIDKTKLDEISRTHLYQEVRCMKLVTHPSIIRLYEVIDTQTKLYLIQELGDGGDLYDFIMKHPSGVEEEVARHIFKQTVSAIRYCHKLHVVHRDLKPENLVICTGTDEATSPRVKLTDFGLSRTFLPGELIESSCGSLEYSAPEILLGDSYDPPKIDVWSLGVILFMLITGHSPFAYGGAGEILARIMDGKYQCPAQVSDQCRNLIGVMLKVDSQKRASLQQVSSHEWLKGGVAEEVVPLPSISNVDEVPPSELNVILGRMDQGGYGSMDSILRQLREKPYDSTAATFYLLVEAERHRKMSRTQHPSPPTRLRKSSTPFSPIRTPNGPHFNLATPPTIRSHGSAETGFLQRHYTLATPTNHTSSPLSADDSSIREEPDGFSPAARYRTTPARMTTPPRMSLNHAFNSPRTAFSPMTKQTSDSALVMSNATPTSQMNRQTQSKPNLGVAGDHRSHTPRSAFPLNVQPAEEQHNHSTPSDITPPDFTPSDSAPSDGVHSDSTPSAMAASPHLPPSTTHTPSVASSGSFQPPPFSSPSSFQAQPHPPTLQSHPPNLPLQSHPPNLPLQSHPPNLPLQSHPPNLPLQSHPPNLPQQPHPPNLPQQPHPPNLPLQPLLLPSTLGRINLESNQPLYRTRALSIFEEESETESIPDQSQSRQLSTSPSHQSPVHHPGSPAHLSSPRSRSRKLQNARSSPNIFGSMSKSDISEDDDEEEEDDIVELMTTSGRFPNKGSTFPRTSPSNSPLLTSRCSPTHYLTGGSSEDEAGNIFEAARKNRSKRHPYRKRSIPKLVRVDSISSDDGKSPRDTQPSRKGRLLRLRQYNSLPATPAENSASESLTDILDTLRKRQTTTSSNVSGRTDSSVSDAGSRGTGDRDMGDLASSIVAKFELSDEDGLQASMELDPAKCGTENQEPGVASCTSLSNVDVRSSLVRPQSSTTLRSVICCIL